MYNNLKKLYFLNSLQKQKGYLKPNENEIKYHNKNIRYSS